MQGGRIGHGLPQALPFYAHANGDSMASGGCCVVAVLCCSQTLSCRVSAWGRVGVVLCRAFSFVLCRGALRPWSLRGGRGSGIMVCCSQTLSCRVSAWGRGGVVLCRENFVSVFLLCVLCGAVCVFVFRVCGLAWLGLACPKAFRCGLTVQAFHHRPPV